MRQVLSRLVWYLELDVVHWRRRDHAVEGGKAMLVANLLTVQLKLRLPYFPVHIQSYHRLNGDRRKDQTQSETESRRLDY